MPVPIYNTASLTFEFGSQKKSASSNIAMTTLQEALSITKSSLGEAYTENGEITFMISVTNNYTESVKNIKITDNLGSYSLNSNLCDKLFTPLTYIGPSFLYLGGTLFSNIEPKVLQDKITFTVPTIPAKSNALIIYKTYVNEFAPLVTGSTITSTATLSSKILTHSLNASVSITVKDQADVRIIKNMSPNPVLPGEKITYSFSLYNYGNTEAKNVVLNDTFIPSPEVISVYLNSSEILPDDFSYINGTLTIPSYDSKLDISVPPATFEQDSVTGTISPTPGIVSIIVKGQI